MIYTLYGAGPTYLAFLAVMKAIRFSLRAKASIINAIKQNKKFRMFYNIIVEVCPLIINILVSFRE